MSDIPAPVRRFVEDHIKSVGLLEVLLLLESDPSRAWTTKEVSAELRTHGSWAATQLDYLVERGLAARANGGEPSFRYRPSGAGTRFAVEELRRAFEKRRVGLVSLIYSEARDHTDEE